MLIESTNNTKWRQAAEEKSLHASIPDRHWGHFVAQWNRIPFGHQKGIDEGPGKMSIPAIQVEELKQRLDAGENLFLLDVREEHEYEISNIGGHLIPLAELPGQIDELDATRS